MNLFIRMEAFCEAIQDEYNTARTLFPKFHSAHEAYAVLLEEVEEFWQEVKKKDQSPEAMRKELIQIAAMSMSAVLDLSLDTEGPHA